MLVDMWFEKLEAVRGISVEDVYKLVDAHMTDSKELSMGFQAVCEDVQLENTSRKIFCGTHTTMGFISAVNLVMQLVESEMKME
ncbi:hypothetical protein DPMN_147450 [Dreissena polymorpha]|uniref:Uncharacterized protein n=1 Tax=Dreissena polymorpha TaxID=45954 RepID=A0A9D4J2Z6_DREPO|nr:hypothetical protein DPMN_147450 [Dreissena polymorpha]